MCKDRCIPRTTHSAHARPLAANVLDRRFTIDAPVSAWVSDITYLPTREDWLYPASLSPANTPGVGLQPCLDAR